jgi:hypothetical protein
MIRGTTPTHVFSKLPVLSVNIQEIWITYLQGGKTVLTRDKSTVTFTDDVAEETCTATIKLTQEETLSFTSGPASVQLRLLLTDDTAFASDEVPLTVKRIIHDGKIE